MATAGRVVCARCGANNFETQAACWKCASPLAPGVAAPAPNANGAARHAAPLSLSADAPARPVFDVVDPAVAHWVGIIGGLLIPLAMLPVGLAFLMWDDRRKVEVGRTATLASIAGTLIHGVLTYFAVVGAVQMGMKMLPGAADRAKAAQSAPADRNQDPNTPVKPLELPGIPSLSPPEKR